MATEDDLEQAWYEADFKLTAHRNGACWAGPEIDAGRGHLEKHFPDVAQRLLPTAPTDPKTERAIPIKPLE